MLKRNNNTRHSRISLVLVIALFFQAMIPLGYMPDNIFSGNGWVTICPQQQPDLFRLLPNDQHHQHHHHHTHSDDQLQSVNSCDWAAFIGQFDWLSPQNTLFNWQAIDNQHQPIIHSPLYRQTKTAASIRAPPISRLV